MGLLTDLRSELISAVKIAVRSEATDDVLLRPDVKRVEFDSADNNKIYLTVVDPAENKRTFCVTISEVKKKEVN